jgi:hypothetical protein
MSLLFRVKSARASAIKLQIGHVSHEYRVTRSSSSTRSNLALAQQAQKALWYNGSGQVEPGKFPLRKTRTSSYFKRQITELNEFYASQIEPHRAKVKFAGSEEKPFVMEHKRQIKKLLQTHAPHLNWRHYVAAAEVFPMRANNYFLENHINWLVPILIQPTASGKRQSSNKRLKVSCADKKIGRISPMTRCSSWCSLSRKCSPHPSCRKC